MTETQNVLEKNFDIWYVNKSTPTVITSPTGAVVSAPAAEKVTVKCTADLICKAALTPSSDNEPVKVMLDWFKLTQIPDTMAIKAFSKGKALLTKWFNAEAYSMTKGEKHGDDLYSHPELIDNTTITLEWLQGYSRVREAISKLRDVDYLMRAKDPLRNKLKNAGLLDGRSHTILPWNGQLTDLFHKNWQFQLVRIDTSFNDLMERYLAGPDDLYAALGGFEMAAAIAEVTVTPMSSNNYLVTIPRIVIYARDTYDFNDDKGGSQYLGHWNHHDLDISLGAYLDNYDDSPLVHYSGDKPTKENTYFCVRNKHFRKWREKYGKGGDMLVFSNGQSFKPISSQMFEGTQETYLQFVI